MSAWKVFDAVGNTVFRLVVAVSLVAGIGDLFIGAVWQGIVALALVALIIVLAVVLQHLDRRLAAAQERIKARP